MNLKLIQIARDCEYLTVDETKLLIGHLKTLIDAEELSSVPVVSGWRKRVISDRIEQEEHKDD